MEMREVFGHILVELGKENPKVLVLDADVKTTTRTDIFAEALPKQFFQFGIAEQNMFCAAAGLATLGFIPFPTTLAVFAARRACDQVEISIAYPRLNVKIPGTYNGIPIGRQGATHASVDDLSIMRSMPNMRVVDPADNLELRQVMRAAVEYYGPVYFRVSRPEAPNVLDEGYNFQWGKSVVLRDGENLTLISTGVTTSRTVMAADILAKKGIGARVIHMPCLKPIDKEAIITASDETKTIVTVENHSIYGGLGSAVAEVLVENAPCRQKRLGFQDVFLEGASDEELFRKHKLTPDAIADDAIAFLQQKQKYPVERS
jgi:transketolase